MIVRAAMPGNAASVRGILCEAFAGNQEADLVERLGCTGELLLSMVAEEAGHIVGYIGFSRLWIARGGRRSPGTSLAPLAVKAGHRRRGIGAALVEAGHAQLRAAGESIVFVLGEPAYYGRFGYLVSAGTAFDCAYAGPYFQAFALSDNAPQAGAITYAAAFQHLQ